MNAYDRLLPGSNRLHKVSDGAPDADGGTYAHYNDIRQGQNDNNYIYDVSIRPTTSLPMVFGGSPSRVK